MKTNALIGVVILVLMYLGCSFAHMTFDPNPWGSEARVLALVLSLIAWMFGCITIGLSESDKNAKRRYPY